MTAIAIKLRLVPTFCLLIFTAGCMAQDDPAAEFEIPAEADTIQKVQLSESEWKNRLSESEYHILREQGTERAYSHPYWKKKESGIYTCAACGLPLFDSDTKFKSGTGWPSFYEPVQANHIHYKNDRSYGSVRVEVVCARCEGHLGHVFKDGPEPTGLRYCINGEALEFRPDDK